MGNERTKNIEDDSSDGPTSEQRYTVEIMSGIGTSVEDIALALEVSQDWLRRHCEEELRAGGTRAKTRVVESLYRQALTGNVQAAQAFVRMVEAGEHKQRQQRRK